MSSLSNGSIRPTVDTGSFVFYATTFATFMAASAASTPLYRLYQQMWSISPVMITLVFAVYAFALLAALLVGGSLSDHVGRKPVIFAGLVLQSVAMVLFLLADSGGALLAARLMQGVATGLATTSLGAAVVDADYRRGPVVNSFSPLGGMGLGALASGALVAFAPAPSHLVYVLLLALTVFQAGMIWRLPETVRRKPGALAALDPRVTVPASARRAFVLLSPTNLSIWMLGGFFLSLIPSVVARATGISSPFLGGVVVASLMFSGGLSVLALRGQRPVVLMTFGTTAISVGIVTLVIGVFTGALALLAIGSVVTGLGWGACFSGVMRTLLPLAKADERAELLAVYYIESYLAMSVPAIGAGFLAASIGLAPTTLVFGTLVLALNVGGHILLRATGLVAGGAAVAA
ncbi:MFS transporter [Breoghania corrubedonensis]|uniref:MFS transporter n=1 Tax=Breoghania corrubedonensis TaxID=665038 RepID=A0A2T5V1I5_9HYPH|nr:MFS transporter [Breoghania corrubedonensis]PTW57588.1 MFS transporter [Breoghania corrubedonensis]